MLLMAVSVSVTLGVALGLRFLICFFLVILICFLFFFPDKERHELHNMISLLSSI